MDDVNGFSCKCAPGYTGRTCNIDINDCVGTLCLNGGTCMDDVNGFSCKCAPGYKGRTCIEPAAKIFVTDEGTQDKIFVAYLQDDLDFTDIPSTKEPRYITYDSVEKKIYWTDKETKRVHRADVDGGNREAVTFESNDELRGIAIAETSRTLYIANKSPSKISSVSIAKGSSFPRSDKDFRTGISQDLYSLEVDEEKGFLYWSMENRVHGGKLDGSQQIAIFIFGYLLKITGLTIDLSRDPRRIFFCDYEREETFYQAANTQDIYNAKELTDYMDDPDINSSAEEREQMRDISYFNGSLYWTKTGSHKGIAVMTNYDSTNVSFHVKEAGVINEPFQLLIIEVNP